MGNASTKSHRSKGLSISSSSRIGRWEGPGIPAPPGKPILIPGTEDSQPDVVGIRWERSPSNGGSAIVGYLVEHRRLGSPHWLRSAPVLCTFPELTLSGLEPGWRYQFRVRAQNAVGLSRPSEISDPLTVTLQRAASCAPQFDLELADTIALENEHTEFIVRFSGAPLPKISWFKDGFEIFSSRRTRIITENGKSVLLIHQTALNDEGEIKCTATNRAGHVSTKAKLILEALPRIRLPRQYEDGLLFEQGETVRLKVSLAGKPPPSVIWYHDGETIPDDERHVFETMDGEATLKIPDTTREDRGEYTVKAVNKLGEDMSSFLVTVTGRPAPPGKATVTMTLGRSVSLSWKEPEDDGGCKIGTYIVEYYRIGWDVWLKAATSRQTATTLTELIEGSEYKFRVKAENPYGISDPSEESDVIFIPDLKRGITSPSLTGKSQSQREISRSRGEKREVSFAEPPQRSRSLTREEAVSRDETVERSLSAQRLSAAGRPSRADSRVTFAENTLVLIDRSEAPVPPARSKDHHSNKQDNQIGNYVNRANTDTDAVNTESVPRLRERPTSPKTVTSVAISPPPIEEPHRRSMYRESRSRSVSRSRERSLSPLTKIQESRAEESITDAIHPPRPSLNLMSKRESTTLDESSDILIRRKSVPLDDDLGLSTMPREDDENELRGSSEFMIVLYPEDHEHAEKSDQRERTGGIETPVPGTTPTTAEEDEDLVPPPLSLSLPELFSADHQIVETIREAVSSTELLHERAMERFYRAVAAEEATEAAKRKSILERETGELATSKPVDETKQLKTTEDSEATEFRTSSLRRRLSNSGVTSQTLITSWQAKKNRRRSSEGQAEPNLATTKLPLPVYLPDLEAWSDPNLPGDGEISTTEPWRRSNDAEAVERLRRWHESHEPLVESKAEEKSIPWTGTNDEARESQLTIPSVNQQVRNVEARLEDKEFEEVESVETSIESSEDVSSADSEDLKLLKSRILARQVIEEEDTYHPRGRPTPHIITDELPVSPYIPPSSPTNVMPKSILKKRPDDPVPVNNYGRPVPPEKPIRKIPPQPRAAEVELSPKREIVTSPPETKPALMSEADTDSIMHAAEAAKNRRIQAKMRSLTPDGEENEADIEARMAMVNHYTELVREHSVHPPIHKPSLEAKVNQKGEDLKVQPPEVRRPSIVADREPKIKERAEEKQPSRPKRPETPDIQRPKAKVKGEVKEAERQGNKIQQPDSRRSSMGSRGTTPAREIKAPKETRRGRTPSRNQSPVSRSRNVSQERGGASSRSSSKTRARTPSRDRNARAQSRAPSEESRHSREKSVEPGPKRSRPSSRPSSRASSRTPSRSSSTDRYRASTPVNAKMERLQKAIESKKYRSLMKASTADSDSTEEMRRSQTNGKQLAVRAQIAVRSTISYVIDVTLLIAAVYVYLFKKETLAIPFIALLLYRRIQQEIHSRMPRRWWPFKPKQ